MNILSNATVSRILHFTTNTAVLPLPVLSALHLMLEASVLASILSQLYLRIPEAGRLLSKYSPLAEVEQSVPESSHPVGLKEETAVTKTGTLQFFPKMCSQMLSRMLGFFPHRLLNKPAMTKQLQYYRSSSLLSRFPA